MVTSEKLAQLKSLLNITDTTQDSQLTVYLGFCKNEILSWVYSGQTPDGIVDVPVRYEPTQIMACVVGYGLSGVEGQTSHTENSISRTFKYEDAIAYIRSHCVAFAQVI